jgi:hypothetical protein
MSHLHSVISIVECQGSACSDSFSSRSESVTFAMCYTILQQTSIVKSLIRKKTCRKCTCKFICKYPEVQVPSCVSKLVKMWWTKGSVCDEWRQSKMNVLTEESSRHSGILRDQPPQFKMLGVSVGSASIGTQH